MEESKVPRDIIAKLKVSGASHSTITGVQIGISEERMGEIIESALQRHLSGLSPPAVQILDSFYICRGEDAPGSAGFAINNSGAILCSPFLKRPRWVIELITGAEHEVRTSKLCGKWQKLTIPARTKGLAPAFDYELMSGPLWAISANDNERVKLEITAFNLALPDIRLPDGESRFLDGLIELQSNRAIKVYPGSPLLTINNEVAGLIVAQDEFGYLFALPWVPSWYG